MWTRKELKTRAKEALKRNYWKTVLVAALAIIMNRGVMVASNYSFPSSKESAVSMDAIEEAGGMELSGVEEDEDVELSGTAEEAGGMELSGAVEEAGGMELSDVVEEAGGMELSDVVEDNDNRDFMSAAENADMEEEPADGDKTDAQVYEAQEVLITVAIVVLVVLLGLLLFAIVFALVALLVNPFYVGVHRFMLKNVEDEAQVREIAYGFDHSYKNIVWTMFQVDVRVLLWALLFVIPGIYKKYQYRMVTYILAEHPDMNYREALRISRDMMDGEKWHAFVLDLSFVLWHMLGMITCGIAEAFYVHPYMEMTNAFLYRRLEQQVQEQADEGGKGRWQNAV